MKKFLASFVLLVLVSSGTTNWVNYARFENFDEYFYNLLQEMIYEMEDHGWSNFKLNDQVININEVIYDKTFQGQVNYTNGFLVSTQYLNVMTLQQYFLRSSSTFVTTGTMHSVFHFHDVVVGYDVSADLGDMGVHKFTGIFNHDTIIFEIFVRQDLNTSAITTSAELLNLSSGSGNYMIYLPDTYISEVLSRHYESYMHFDGVRTWATQFMQPKLLEIINRTDFPRVCFNC